MPPADRELDLDQTTVVTILFTDLVASTETMERVGDDRAEGSSGSVADA